MSIGKVFKVTGMVLILLSMLGCVVSCFTTCGGMVAAPGELPANTSADQVADAMGPAATIAAVGVTGGFLSIIGIIVGVFMIGAGFIIDYARKKEQS